MAHLDKRMDPDKAPASGPEGGVKDGTSGNVPDNAKHDGDKLGEATETAEPDVVSKGGVQGGNGPAT